MNPLLLLILAILTPFILLTTLLVAPYCGIYGACYIIYHTGKVDPLTDKFSDVFYVIDVYSKVLSYWMGHITSVSFVNYTLPVVALPLFCVFFALWLTRRAARKMKNIFHLSASI